MFVIDTPIALLIGTAVALKSKGDANSIEQRDRAFSRGLLIQSLVITPVIVYFLMQFSDWELSYLVDAKTAMESEYKGLLALGFTIWLTGLYVAGFNWGEKLITAGKRAQLGWIVKLLLLLIVVVTGLVIDETIHLGSTADYHAGLAVSVMENTQFMTVVCLGFPSWIAAYYWAVRPVR